jgi:hypothetical protein
MHALSGNGTPQNRSKQHDNCCFAWKEDVMTQTTEYKGYKLTASAEQRDGKWYGAYVREKNGDVFRSEMSVIESGSQASAETQLLDVAREHINRLDK